MCAGLADDEVDDMVETVRGWFVVRIVVVNGVAVALVVVAEAGDDDKVSKAVGVGDDDDEL